MNNVSQVNRLIHGNYIKKIKMLFDKMDFRQRSNANLNYTNIV